MSAQSVIELVEEIRAIALDDLINPDKALMKILDVCDDALSDDQQLKEQSP